MTSRDELFARAKAIFVTAIERPPDEREAFVKSQCGDDEALLAEVHSLLSHHHDDPGRNYDATTSGLETSANAPEAASGMAFGASTVPSDAPSTIGGYRIVRELGRGGMGIVYLAVREEGSFQRRAALKVIKRGMDSEQILRRFELERQVLSALNHPNIARLYDAGTTDDGRPYFAMEYIDGMPIDTYCDRRRLTIDDRLTLFHSVCDAVQYAHRNLVVHRDLKPANILITNEGVPKLLDFGIAKLLNPEMSMIAGDPTAPEFRVMTPEYASPEQVRGEQVTTTSDVYSLGVLLYELMTGHRPYRFRSRVRAEIERIVCEEEPERPSTAISRVDDDGSAEPTSGTADKTGKPSTSTTLESVSKTRSVRPDRLRRRLAGDIDNIIMAAMRKEPQRRYPSVEKFAEDIDRHLNRLPISARPNNFLYRSNKFIKRNKAGVSIAALIAITATTTLALAWNAKALDVANARATALDARAAKATAEAEAQRTRSQSRAERVRDLLQLMLHDYHNEIEQLDGGMTARRLLVSSALEYLERLAAEEQDSIELQLELARAYQRIGDIQGGIRGQNLGEHSDALESYRTAESILERALTQVPNNDALQHARALNHLRVGDMLMRTGLSKDAISHYQSYFNYFDQHAATNRIDLSARRNFVAALNQLGAQSRREGRHDEAVDYYRRSLVESQANMRMFPDNPDVLRDLTVVQLRLASRYRDAGDLDAAMELSLGVLAGRQQLSELDPHNATFQRDVGIAHYAVGQDARALEQHDIAHQHYSDFQRIAQIVVTNNPEDRRSQSDLLLAHQMLTDTALIFGDADDALQHIEQAITIGDALAGTDPANSLYRLLAIRNFLYRGRVHVAMGERAQAKAMFEHAITMTKRAIEASPNHQEFADLLELIQTELDAIDQP